MTDTPKKSYSIKECDISIAGHPIKSAVGDMSYDPDCIKTVFVESPYAGDVESNLNYAREAMRHVIDQGHAPVVAHLMYPQCLDDENPIEREHALKMCKALRDQCDEVWFFADFGISSGMARGIEECKDLDNVYMVRIAREAPFRIKLGADIPLPDKSGDEQPNKSWAQTPFRDWPEDVKKRAFDLINAPPKWSDKGDRFKCDTRPIVDESSEVYERFVEFGDLKVGAKFRFVFDPQNGRNLDGRDIYTKTKMYASSQEKNADHANGSSVYVFENSRVATQDVHLIVNYDDSAFHSTADDIERECNAIRDLLIEKNRKYGDSALNPKRIFSQASATEQIKVRIDDKLSRLKAAQIDEDEDVIKDLIGYLILLRIASARQ